MNYQIRIQPIRIASFPIPSEDTYYFWLYYEHLNKLGYELIDTKGKAFSSEWLKTNKGQVQIIHFHWPAYIYSKKGTREFLHSFVSFSRYLIEARSLGYKIAWTVHNVFPHERNNIIFEYLCRFCLAHMADVIFVHFEEARHAIARTFLKFDNVYKIPHGNFKSVFQNCCTKAEARQKLHLSEKSFVFLIFGPVRPYKGIEEAVEAFRRSASADDILLVVGNPSDETISGWLADIAASDHRIVPHLRFVPKEEVQYFFNASDAVLLPYKKIFTSGNLFLALSFGKPVICPDMGVISEVVDSEVGIKYAPCPDGSTLCNAIRDIKDMPAKKCCEAALKKAESFTWEEAAAISAEAFSQCRRNR